MGLPKSTSFQRTEGRDESEKWVFTILESQVGTAVGILDLVKTIFGWGDEPKLSGGPNIGNLVLFPALDLGTYMHNEQAMPA